MAKQNTYFKLDDLHAVLQITTQQHFDFELS